MQRVNKFIIDNKFLFLGFILILLVYGITRLIHLTSVPIFTDEAIYIRWAQIAKQDSTERFISLTDGKQPLFIWAMIPMLKLFSDPLVAGRMVSVFSGIGSMMGLYFFGRELFKNKWVGFVSALLYVLYPMVLVHDRLAIYDSMVGMFFIWSLYFTILLVRYIRLDIALLLSMITGAGLLTKSSNEVNLALFPVSLLLFDWKQKKRNERLGRWVVFAVIAGILSLVYYSILRLSPFFYIISQKNATFNYPLHEWLHHPFTYLIGNFHGYFGWFLTYVTIPIVLLMIAAFVINKKHFLEKVFLFFSFLPGFTYAIFFGKVLYPRYLLFMTLPLLILAAYSIVFMYEKLKNKQLAVFAIAVLLLQSFVVDFTILTNFPHALIPDSDKEQYMNGWSAGGGVKEAVRYFTEQAKDKKIYVGTEGTFGLMPFALQIYLDKNPNITIDGYWPIKDTPPVKAISMSQKMPTYFLFYQPCPSCVGDTAPVSWRVTPVLHVVKGIGKHSLTIYKL